MALNQTAIDLLGQLERVLKQIEDDQYLSRVELLGGSSVGQHVRHTLEFFICLMSATPHGVISYDERKRDKYIEEEVAVAISFISSINSNLKKNKDNFSFDLKASYGADEEAILMATNFQRELAYNIEHAIHHMALIKVGLQVVSPSVQLPEHFGVASSTVRYQQGQA
ncbi:hypothetical protein [Marinoscillum sp. MHG1-6]|uniref:hypothetical protein n=1 Tax=Marinoscillum sp. MHG1-6 TaxID=2959627 RepID=UPI0021573AFB|nr:hypothetical protein [Marinoscillum sp. MHG1-6]